MTRLTANVIPARIERNARINLAMNPRLFRTKQSQSRFPSRTACSSRSSVARVLRPDATGVGIRIDFVAPTRPTGSALAGEEFQIGAGAALFDQSVLLVRLSRVFALAAGYDIHLPPAGSQRPQLAPHAEEQELCHIAEIKPHAAAIRSAVLADLEP